MTKDAAPGGNSDVYTGCAVLGIWVFVMWFVIGAFVFSWRHECINMVSVIKYPAEVVTFSKAEGKCK